MANYWKLYKKAKAFYFGIGKIKCPALGGEEITFDQRGFRHFLHKGSGKGKRPIVDQIRRFKLLTQIHFLIENSRLSNGEEKEMRFLKSGDEILTIDQSKLVSTEVIFMLDKQISKKGLFFVF